MRILHIIYSFSIGGAENMLVDIINKQVTRDNNKITLIVINNKYNKELLNRLHPAAKYLLVKRPEGSKNPFFILKIWWMILQEKPSIIHCNDHNCFPFILPWKNKSVITVHDTNLATTYLNKYKLVIAISRSVQEDLFKRVRLRSTLVYNGINTQRIKVKEHTLQNKNFKILQISRLDHNKKGQHILIEAVSKLIHEDKIRNISIDFIGEGDSETYLKALVTMNNLCEYIHFLGAKDRDEIYDCLGEYDLLVQPSIYEGFGLTVVEAMSAKVPVLVSSNEGPIEVIENGEYGFYFINKDVEDCRQKIKEIIEKKESLSFLIENAYRHAIKKFDISITAAKYLDLYKSIQKGNLIKHESK